MSKSVISWSKFGFVIARCALNTPWRVFSLLKSKRRMKKFFDQTAGAYPYTVADLREPRFYRHCMKRMRIALGTTNGSENSKILDIGCGTAYFTFLLSKLNKQVIGIDLSKSMIKIGKRSLTYERTESKIELVLADGEHLPFKNNTFDIVFCLDFLHHVSNVSPVIREMARVAILDGKIVAIEPNFLNPLYAILCLVRNEESFERFLKASRRELGKLFKESNMDNITAKTLDFYPQLFLKLSSFPDELSRFLDYLEELLRRQPAFSFLSSHFAITGRKKS